VNLDINVRC